ncbi:GNAT family N-acetyltransferase [Paracoccus sp. (in: a-proteobacteria)]|uniref:GNAT family N-acetyltransferase n=1 Tax=Paracoccus sp. TaxID=267 RepID=UPI002F428A96
MTQPEPAQPLSDMPMPQGLTIRPEPPTDAALDLLFQRHHQAMHADTPPESIHMMPREALVSPEIAFFVLREADRPLAMGALKDLGGGLAEIKSMHVLSETRGRGLSRLLLRHMIAIARQRGFVRLSLETGAQPSFAAARRLYASEGFAECPPFGDYRPDPNSTFMTLSLD